MLRPASVSRHVLCYLLVASCSFLPLMPGATGAHQLESADYETEHVQTATGGSGVALLAVLLVEEEEQQTKRELSRLESGGEADFAANLQPKSCSPACFFSAALQLPHGLTLRTSEIRLQI